MSQCFYNKNIINSTIFTFCNLFEIILCTFIENKINRELENGGIIFVSSINSIIKLQKNSFNFCRAKNGGCIYINSPNFTYFENNCFFNCSALNLGQCIYIINKESNSIFEAKFCSINNCPWNYMGENADIFIKYSISKTNNFNFSNSFFKGYDIIYNYYCNYIEQIYTNCINIKSAIIIDYARSSNGLLSNSNFINNSYNNHNIYNYFIWDIGALNLTFLNSILINNFFINFTSHFIFNNNNCIYFNNYFINSSILILPNTLNLNLLKNCNFYEKTFLKFNLFNFYQFFYLFLVE